MIREAQERKEELAQLVGALPIGVILIDDEKDTLYKQRGLDDLRQSGLPARGSSVS